jgi:hypothetical protein
MNLDDYLRWQRQSEELLKRSRSPMDSFESDLRKISSPIHESLLNDTAFTRMIRDGERARALTDDITSALLRPGLGSLAESIGLQRPWYEQHLAIANKSPLESTYLFNRLQQDAQEHISAFVTGSDVRDELYGVINVIGIASKSITDPLSSAALATAFAGWNDVVEDAQGHLEWALTNPFAETARSFAESSRMLAEATNPSTARAIERSLLLTDAELRTTARSLAKITINDEHSAPVDTRRRRLLAPRVQRVELRRNTTVFDDDADLEDVLAATAIGQCILVSREIIRILIDLSDSYAFATPIVKATERFALACAELSFAVPVDRQTFADFIDYLYWLLYEAPGGGSLKYLTEHGGPFEREDCQIVFVIKRMRNYCRHDLDHGSERDIQKKREALREDLRSRGVEQLGSRASYRVIHRALLEETLLFVQKLRVAVAT